jgi:hypothetical protein
VSDLTQKDRGGNATNFMSTVLPKWIKTESDLHRAGDAVTNKLTTMYGTTLSHSLLGIRVLLDRKFDQVTISYMLKKTSLENLDVLFSNDIIFKLYNLNYIGQINNLEIRR